MLLESEGEAVCTHCVKHEEEDTKTSMNEKYALAGISSATWVVAILVELLWQNQLIVYSLSIAAILMAGRWIIPRGLRGAAKIHLDINFLMTFAAVAALIIGAPLEGAAAMYLFFIANLLEDRASVQVRNDIQGLLELAPHMITMKTSSGLVEVPVESGQMGEVFVVRPGDRIGLDGIVVSGTTSVNQSPITGESVPVSKQVGDTVYAGTINMDGSVEIEVTHLSSETVLSRIVSLVDEARSKRSPTEKLVSRVSHRYTPMVVLASAAMAVVTFAFGFTLQDAVYRGLTLLVTSCPCAFVISIPVSMVSSIAGSARSGVLVKGSEYIEALSKSSVVAFDKTGTLTEGVLQVENITMANGATREEVLHIAGSLEQYSEHPISRAVTQLAEIEKVTLGTVDSFQAIAGRGVTGEIAGSKVVAGNRGLMQEKGIDIPDNDTQKAGTNVYIAKNGNHVGTIRLMDSVRHTARRAIQELSAMGIRSVMLTGDNEPTADHVAKILQVDEYHADLLPHEKVEAVESITDEGTHLFVGDGINDAPAMAASDVSVAMGVIGSDLALETADVALMEDDLEKIPILIQQAQKTMSIVKQNIAVSIGIKAAVAILAIAGLATLWLAVGVGDMGVSLLVIANALRLAMRR
ncbi:MAG: heavy metal translocating P-type ATPase [Candidatus Thorarchaeota archaeon]|jgi:Cd2+/Zn2+-exporting ATPase